MLPNEMLRTGEEADNSLDSGRGVQDVPGRRVQVPGSQAASGLAGYHEDIGISIGTILWVTKNHSA